MASCTWFLTKLLFGRRRLAPSHARLIVVLCMPQGAWPPMPCRAGLGPNVTLGTSESRTALEGLDWRQYSTHWLCSKGDFRMIHSGCMHEQPRLPPFFIDSRGFGSSVFFRAGSSLKSKRSFYV